MTTWHDLATPALVVDVAAFERNAAAMAAVRPGRALRPHVKAFKSTDLARYLATEHGHDTFCCATQREVEGMAAAGLGADLLLANEVTDATRSGQVVADGHRVTLAVDSDETVDAAAAAGVRDVLIDVNVGLPRCGCEPSDAGRLADRARDRGMTVRGVMGYEGHLQHWPERERRAAGVSDSMVLLRQAHEAAGGDVVSAGGTGTFDLYDEWVTEVQAGSYVLMDLDYGAVDVPFEPALAMVATVISVNQGGGWFVVDAGLKAFGMDAGPPTTDVGDVFFCSDEHTTITVDPAAMPKVGQRIRMAPGHIDPTIAKHPRLHLLDSEGSVIDSWVVDLAGW